MQKKENKQIKPIRILFKTICLSLIASILIFTATDIIVNFTYKSLAARNRKIETETELMNDLLYYLEYPEEAESDGIEINNAYIVSAMTPIKAFIDGRYDCSDFSMPTIIRLIYSHYEEIQAISPIGAKMMKDMMLGAKYWMTEPGIDSICFWSENHQILYATSEYLVGNYWPDEIFTNDGKTGLEHMNIARDRITYWLDHRFYYGFTEYNSANYASFNCGPLSNFIQFANENDSSLVKKAKIVMDLFFYDLASNSYNYVYMAPTARAYIYNMTGIEGDGMRKYSNYIWNMNDEKNSIRHRIFINFVLMYEAKDKQGNPYYEIPEIIKEIGRDTSTKVIKSSSGLNISEIEEKGYIGQSDEQIMMQFGMEAFTNPEVIQNSIEYFDNNNMFNNKTLNYFKYFNLALFKRFNLLEKISENYNPMPNGIALQRANIYTYQTEKYQLATNQAYFPGIYGASQMLSIANFTENAVVFTTHPAQYESKKSVKAYPGYWAGFGRAPHSVQYQNIQLSIFQLPEKSGFLELYDVPQFTHTYLPEAFFDRVIIDGKYAFAEVNGAFLALIGNNDLQYLDYNNDSALAFENNLEEYPNKKFDLIQNGLNQFWIYELSDINNESFVDFILRIKTNKVVFDGKNNLSYESKNDKLLLQYKGDFSLNNEVQNLEYKRFDCDYIIADREIDKMNFHYNGYYLTLDYKKLQRDYN